MRIAYVISLTEKSIGFEHLFEHLKSEHLDFHIILINEKPSILYNNLKAKGISITELYYSGKKSIPKLILKTRRILKKQKVDIVHTHLLEGGFIGGFAARLAGIPRRIYTRHHGDAHFYETKRGRLYDRLIHSFHDTIICLSTGHYNFLKNQEKLGDKLVLVPNFVDPKIYDISEETKTRIRKKYGFSNDRLNIGINSRWTELKGLQYVLPAIINIYKKAEIPFHLYLFNAKGNYSAEVEKLLANLPDSQYTATVFESEIMAIYPELDIFIHCPVRETAESFGLVYVEALGSGTPSVFTLSGIAHDIVVPGKNALVVDFCSPVQIEEAIEKLAKNSELRRTFASQPAEIRELFSIKIHANRLLKIYERRH